MCLSSGSLVARVTVSGLLSPELDASSEEVSSISRSKDQQVLFAIMRPLADAVFHVSLPARTGLRLQYGERKKRPKFWPQNVPWVKGKPLSMMNHAQLSSVFAAM